MNDTTPSYRCKVSSGNSVASLHLGWRSYKVTVIEMSRDSFSVRVPSSIGAKIRIGKSLKLFYQEMLWKVLCRQKTTGENNQVELEFQQIAELTPMTISSSRLRGKAGQTSAIPKDNSLGVMSGVALLLIIMIMPAWGGRWGTSDAICTAVQSTWIALSELVGLKG